MTDADNTTIFDLIVAYSGAIAKSARNGNYKEAVPFSANSKNEIYNDSYRYFLSRCKKMGIKAAFATSDDIIGEGLFQSFWTYDKGWKRNYGKAHSKIFLYKFTPTTQKQKLKLKLLTDSKSIYLFNNQRLKDIFQNKLNTYKHFKEFAIPTVEVKNLSAREVNTAKGEMDSLLKKSKYKNDFNGSYIIKDKTGSSGLKIFKVNFDKSGIANGDEITRQFESDKKRKKISSYIMQPFIDCNDGFVFGKSGGLIDLRVIVLNDEIIQTYIRIAKKGSFKCNEHQGGDLIYIPINEIPREVLAMTGKIIKSLKKKLNLKHSLYALDFIRSDSGNLYFIEGNDRPGLDWNHKKAINERKAKELINMIVDELKLIVKEKNI